MFRLVAHDSRTYPRAPFTRVAPGLNRPAGVLHYGKKEDNEKEIHTGRAVLTFLAGSALGVGAGLLVSKASSREKAKWLLYEQGGRRPRQAPGTPLPLIARYPRGQTSATPSDSGVFLGDRSAYHSLGDRSAYHSLGDRSAYHSFAGTGSLPVPRLMTPRSAVTPGAPP